jgi:outer membrane protein OmpA-like peptidoglycan-associated protein
MIRSEVRTAEAWRGYDRTALIIALLGLLALLLLWWLGYGPTQAGCCAAPIVVTSPAIQPTAPAPVPAPAPPPAPVRVEPPAVVAAAPAPEPAKAAAPAAAPAVDCGKLADGASVQFATGSAVLSQEGRAVLDKALDCMKNGRYEIAGHTDSVGNSAANQRLSDARANAVIEYLRSKGIDGNRLTAVGYGDTRPIADNATAEGRARNRRITLTRLP